MTILPDGFYEKLIDGTLEQALFDRFGDNWAEAIQKRNLESKEADDLRHEALISTIRKELSAELRGYSGDDRVEKELALCSGILRQIRGDTTSNLKRPVNILTALDHTRVYNSDLPQAGLSKPHLFTSGRQETSLISEILREIGNVDHVDILVSFITWSGVRKIRDLIQTATAVDARGEPATRFRILTTTYIGATEARAVQWLAEQPGVEVRISLDGRRTRLHAKAWIFRRATGYGTAYVGSANLSGAALTGGLEWTIKTTQDSDPDLYATASAHFETLWEDPEFTFYDANNEEHRQNLIEAIRREKGGGGRLDSSSIPVTFFSLRPKAFQQEILDQLVVERCHGRTRNLVVAATGTGKTVIAAFDYLATCKTARGRPKLLFVAHRKEIIEQARATFIQVLRESGFGTLCAGGSDPDSFDHCFCTVQSFRSKNLAGRFGKEFWHTVIIDECHHMTARSYSDLGALEPKILLGLTATPERADGQPLSPMFHMRVDGTPSAELRLWDALDQQLLSPFEYYGCEDDTDLTNVRWNRRASEISDLNNLLTGNEVRARTVMAAVDQYVSDPSTMRALAFCVSVEHARFMAESFGRHGLKAEVVVGDTDAETRRQAPVKLALGKTQVICTCDLYNEGIDIPDVDTLIMLRPTQSPVLIQQQLGRGLRLSPGKESCLVLDLVGRHSVEFRFDRLLGVLSGLPRRGLREAVEHGFSQLPPGCYIHLDRMTREQVLRNIRETSSNSWRKLVVETQAWANGGPGRRDADLATFLRDTEIELSDLYRGGGGSGGGRGWAALRRACGLEHRTGGVYEAAVSLKIPNLLNQDDPLFLSAVGRVAEQVGDYETASPAERKRIDAVSAELFPSSKDPCSGRDLEDRFIDAPALRDELSQVARILADRIDMETRAVDGMPSDWPFQLHGSYSLRTISIFSGKISPKSRYLPREGLIRFPDQKVEILLVTLDKTIGFSSTTSYHDYAISPDLFHWQTQNSAFPEGGVGLRYLQGPADGWTFQLFVRENKDNLYSALGPVKFKSSEGRKPMSITWQLGVPLPLKLFRRFSVLRAA